MNESGIEAKNIGSLELLLSCEAISKGNSQLLLRRFARKCESRAIVSELFESGQLDEFVGFGKEKAH